MFEIFLKNQNTKERGRGAQKTKKIMKAFKIVTRDKRWLLLYNYKLGRCDMVSEKYTSIYIYISNHYITKQYSTSMPYSTYRW